MRYASAKTELMGSAGQAHIVSKLIEINAGISIAASRQCETARYRDGSSLRSGSAINLGAKFGEIEIRG